MITQKYNYNALSRAEIKGSRLYQLPDGSKVASVTTILDKTKTQESKDALANWRKRVGEQKAKEITQEAAGRGTRMHSYLEDYVKSDILRTPGTNPYSIQSNKMAQIVIEKGLSKVNEFWGMEVGLYFPGIYAGTTDCVGLHENKEAIIDFKQTNKPKKTEWIEDYFMQLAAYSLAHNEVYGSNINRGVILMCSQGFEYQEWVIEGAEFDKYVGKWWDRVEQFYKTN